MAFVFKRGRRIDVRPIVFGQPVATAVQSLIASDTLAFSDAGHTSVVTWLGTLTTKGDFTSGSNVINNVLNVSGYSAGAQISAAPLAGGTTVTFIDVAHNTLTVSNNAGSTTTGTTITITDPALTVGTTTNGTWSWALNLWADWSWPTYYTFLGGALNTGNVTGTIQIVDGGSVTLTQASCSASFTVDNSSSVTTNMTYSISSPIFGAELLTTFNGVRFVWTNSNTALSGILGPCTALLRFKTGARLAP